MKPAGAVILLMLGVTAPVLAQTSTPRTDLTKRGAAHDASAKRALAKRLVAEYVALAKAPEKVLDRLAREAREAVEAAGHKGHEHAHDECKALKAPTAAQLRGKLLAQVRRVPDEAIPHVVAAWQDLTPDLAANLVWAVHRARSPRLLTILKVAATHIDPKLRQMAAAALVGWAAKEPDTVLYLQLQLLEDRSFGVFDVALACLVDMKAKAAWRPALRILKREVARDPARTNWIRTATLGLSRLLRAHPEQRWVDGVAELLSEEKNEGTAATRAAYVRLLGESQTARAVPPLRELLRGIYDPPSDFATDETRDPEPAWVGDLRPFSTSIRLYTVRGIASARAAQDLPLLKLALKDSDWQVRQSAMNAIAVQLQAGVRGQARLDALSAIVPLLVDAARRLRRPAMRVLQKNTGGSIPLSYRKWRAFLVKHGHLLKVEQRLMEEAKDGGFTSLPEWLRKNGHASIEAYLNANGYADAESFLKEARE